MLNYLKTGMVVVLILLITLGWVGSKMQNEADKWREIAHDRFIEIQRLKEANAHLVEMGIYQTVTRIPEKQKEFGRYMFVWLHQTFGGYKDDAYTLSIDSIGVENAFIEYTKTQ